MNQSSGECMVIYLGRYIVALIRVQAVTAHSFASTIKLVVQEILCNMCEQLDESYSSGQKFMPVP